MLTRKRCCCSTGRPFQFFGCPTAGSATGPWAAANYTLEIYSASGGSLLETVTTDSSGIATIESTGTKWVKGADGRYTGENVNLNLTSGTLSAVASGYHCLGGCGVPLKDTVSATFTTLGALTLTFNAGVSRWEGTKSTGGIGYVIRMIQSSNLVTITADSGLCFVGRTTFRCPPSFLISGSVTGGSCGIAGPYTITE